LPMKYFMDGNGFAVNRAAPVQVHNRRLKAGSIARWVTHLANIIITAV